MHLMGDLCRMTCRRSSRDMCCPWRFFAPVFRNRVVAKLAREWMAAQQPLQAQPSAAQHAEALNRLVSILRAGGIKPAVPREQKGQIRFVKTQRQKRDAHGQA